MDSTDNTQNRHSVLNKQPISCPWKNSQPYPSTLNKNKSCEATNNKPVPNIPISIESKTTDKTCSSVSYSSTQFFYFVRLMQLFPETHPATLHTVLTLCKNDFFCAVDKLLYAKRCKALYNRSQFMLKNRSHPYCVNGENCMNCDKKEQVSNKDKKSLEKPNQRKIDNEDERATLGVDKTSTDNQSTKNPK